MEVILLKSYRGKAAGRKIQVTEKEYEYLFSLRAVQKVETKELKQVEKRDTKTKTEKPKPRRKRKLTNE